MTNSDLTTPDAASQTWVDQLPPPLRPYFRLMRADRPVGVWLLFWPCVWGTLIARPDGTHAGEMWRLWLLFFIGSAAMRSAGCIYNDILDRDLDRQVARTAARPLAAGIISLRQAWALLVALCLVGLAVLVQLSGLAIIVALGALVMVAAYPLMKRITWWPQAWLGLTFNWGILVGAAAVANEIRLESLLLYGAAVAWTLGYDTIYALQDKEDDALAGIKSSARRLGKRVTLGVLVFYLITMMLLFSAVIIAGTGALALLMIIPAAHLLWQAWQLHQHKEEKALALFKSNGTLGPLVALALLAA